eukprot:CAMPEP_0119290590 /NCGR_PEP_ID=MMETSP1329-20130426/40969_1 /TAXON_ID=114041 /ORGANISM="Genus nov. species nov., Strain RCC1024" /LENGTH=84 /DNA_ID=CAMNT_0007291411 /DNA_START=83 /DNA_END=334 /DNA_ORIENTATION=+
MSASDEHPQQNAAALPAALSADAVATAVAVLQAALALAPDVYEASKELRPLRQALGPLVARSTARAGLQGDRLQKEAARKLHRR